MGDSVFEKFLISSIAYYYIGIKDFEKADSCLNQYMPYVDSASMMSSYAMAARICYNKKDFTSVKKFCKELLDKGDVYQKRTAYRLLSKTYSVLGNNIVALNYIDLYEQITDSIERITSTEVVARMNASYNYNKYKVENAELKADKAYYMTFGMVLFLIAFTFIVLGMHYYRKNRRRVLQQETLRLNMQQQNKRYIEDNNAKIPELQTQLDAALKENVSVVEKLTRQRELLEAQMETALHRQRTVETARRRIAGSKVYRHVREVADAGGVLSDVESNDMETLILTLFPQFKSSLVGVYTISRQEYRLCLLLRVGGFSGKEMASLLGRSDSAISKSKRKLHDLFVGEGVEASIEDFINSL